MAEASRSSKRKAKPAAARIPMLEWIAAAIGLLLTLGMLGVIGLEAVRGDGSRPPAVEASVERITPTAAGYVVEVRLRNLSSATAAAVQLEGALTRGNGEAATSSATIDYVPGQSTRRVGLFFGEDPRGQRLEVRVLGYSEP